MLLWQMFGEFVPARFLIFVTVGGVDAICTWSFSKSFQRWPASPTPPVFRGGNRHDGRFR